MISNSTAKEYQELISPRRICRCLFQKLVGYDYEITCSDREELLEFDCNVIKRCSYRPSALQARVAQLQGGPRTNTPSL